MESILLSVFVSLFLNLVLADVDIKDLIPVKVVPGTKLYTGIYYTLSLKSFPQGWITWVNKKQNVYNVEVDLDPNALPLYAIGKPYELDNQWTIGPSEKPNQFTLKNRRKSNGFLSYSSVRVGSGFHAAIFDGPSERSKLSAGVEWRDDALWKIQATNSGKYYKLENVGKKGSKLTWTYKRYNKYNYFIQLANYDAGEDAKFLFTPSAIKLVASVSDFEFEENLEDIINDKANQKTVVVFKRRFRNRSTATLTKTVEEIVEFKESVTYSFTESFSMITETSIEGDILLFKSNSSLSFQGGFSDTQPKTKETTRTIPVKGEIKIEPHTQVEVSVVNHILNDVSMPFKAKMVVTGTTQRIVADQPTQTQDGDVPGDIIEAYIRAKGGKKVKVIKRTDSTVEFLVTGTIKANIVVESSVDGKELTKKTIKWDESTDDEVEE